MAEQMRAYGESWQLIVVAPDAALEGRLRAWLPEGTPVQFVQDQQQGKPAALALGLRAAAALHPDICILSDGDVVVEKNALVPLITTLRANAQLGAVTARPVSREPRTTMFGFWSHLLTDAGAHTHRARHAANKAFIDVSGYLWAARWTAIADLQLPPDVLADDAFFSAWIFNHGHGIGYVPEAQVGVWYPKNMHDWFAQKRRSAGGYGQLQTYYRQGVLRRRTSGERGVMRSFWREAFLGIFDALGYPKNLREFWWTLCLVVARLWLWILILKDRLTHRDFASTWVRIESSKE